MRLFQEAAAVDAASDAVNELARNLAGEPRRCRKVECLARNLADFNNASPSIVKNTVLPDWDHSDRTAWPVKLPLDPRLYAPIDARRFPGDCSGDWHVAGTQAAADKAKREQYELAEADRARRQFYGQP